MTTSDERSVRIAKRNAIMDMGIVPYAPRYKKIQSIKECIESCDSRQTLGLLRDINDIVAGPVREISSAGRLTLFRSHGKLSFAKLMDESGEIQLMFHRDQCKMLKNRPPHKVNQSEQSFDPNEKHLRRHVVKMVIIDDDGNIAVSYASSSDNYSLPGGGIDEGDSFYDAVHREALEETGTNVMVLCELPKVHEYLKKRNRHQLVYGFLCKTQGEKGNPEFIESELLDGFSVQWMKLEELESILQYQIDNIKKDVERELLDGIFKRDLIILQSAKAILNKTKEQGNHEGYNTITEVSDDILYDGEVVSPYKFLEKFIDVGDFIGIKGELFYTHKGEPTIFVSEYQLLSKTLRPLGDKFHGMGENQETVYRQRYLDMIHNRDTLERMKLRFRFLKVVRDFYDENGFLEIETPVLGNSASGAAAAPFITHHNDFNLDMYLRISPETSLKKATVGMLEKIFEVAKDFRNEGSDPSHIQEFTMIEHYAAYWSHEDNMIFTEKMFDYIFAKLPELKKIVTVSDKEGNPREVNFQTPWPRVDYVQQILSDSGINVSQYNSNDDEKLRSDILAKGHTWVGIETQATATMIDYLYKKVTRPKIVGPAFIVNYPKTMQPLARQSDLNDKIVEQWQLLINGREVIKAYCELVDPVQQQINFDEQAGAAEKGDDETTSGDPDFVLAMEYGMPCQSGWGMGIDRIFALLTEQSNIRDVVLFPMMKPESQEVVGKSKETMIAVALINKGAGLLAWQEMNTIAHLNAAYGARIGKSLFMQNEITTLDGESIKLNTQHAIIIKSIDSNTSIRALIAKAKEIGCEVSEFTKEMMESSDDAKVAQQTKAILYSDIDYNGVLLYGKKSVVDDLTKEFALYTSSVSHHTIPKTSEHISEGNAFIPEFSSGPKKHGGPLERANDSVSDYPMMNLTQAQGLASKYLTDTLRHCQQVAQIMKYFAKKLGHDEDYWYIVGLLHDIDWDHIGKDSDRHIKADFERIVGEIGLPQEAIDDIKSHGWWLTGVEVENRLVRQYLASVDELSGFLYAYSLMRPTGFQGMERKGINKRLKDLNFAAGVDREHVRNCERFLNIPLEEFAMEVLEGLRM